MPSSTQFYTDEQLGPNQATTPDGFLLCSSVPVARCGTLLYAAGEIPLTPDRDGFIRVHRAPEDVFDPIAIASFAGKPVTDEHPPTYVDPKNWKNYSIGVVLNPRRGDGLKTDSDLLYADLLIQDQIAIEEVRQGKRQVSAGYSADYIQLGPGVGRQTKIIGNHVTLVDVGRCGTRCSIGDKAVAKVPAWKARVMKAYRTKDEGALVEELNKIGDMMGTVLSGDEAADGMGGATTTVDPGGDTHHHIVVNVNHPGTEAKDGDQPGVGTPAPAAAATPSTPSPAPAAGASAGAGGEDLAATVKQLLQRVEALEQAVTVLAKDEDDESDDTDNDDDNATEETASPEDAKEDDSGTPPGEVEGTETTDAELTTNVDNLLNAGPESKIPTKLGTSGGVTGDSMPKNMRVKDSAALQSQFTEALSKAEIIAPGSGIRFPTFDSKVAATVTLDSLCKFRKKVLTAAMQREDAAPIIEAILGGRAAKFEGMTCDSTNIVFNGAAEVLRKRRGSATATQLTPENVYARVNSGMVKTVADMNERNRKFYSGK